MPKGVPIDRQELHEKLWAQRDRRGRVLIHQRELAKDNGWSFHHVSRLIQEFIEEERIRKIGSKYHNVGMYSIRDPGDFQ